MSNTVRALALTVLLVVSAASVGVSGLSAATTESTVTIEGAISYAAGAAAGDVKVMAGNESAFYATQTTADGNYSLSVGENATYNLKYEQYSPDSGDDWARDGNPDIYALGSVSVSESNVSVGETQLPAGHLVNVTVVDESGDPVSNASISVRHFANSAHAGNDATTNANGVARWVDNDQVGLELVGDVVFYVHGPPGYSDNKTSITVTDNRSVKIVLASTTTVEGTITEPDGSAAANDTVAFGKNDVEKGTRTNETGGYRVDLPSNDTYSWEFYQGGPDDPAPADDVPDLYAFGSVAVNGSSATHSATLPSAGNLTVIVERPDGTRVQDARVHFAHHQDGAAVGVDYLTNGSGAAAVEAAGQIWVGVRPPDGSNLRSNGTELVVDGDRTVTIVLREAVNVSGGVVRPDGEPASGWFVHVDDTAESARGFGEFTAADGSFAGPVDVNASYATVFHQQADHDPSTADYPDDGVVDLAVLNEFSVGTSDVALGNLTLPAAHELNVTVVNGSGAPVSGVDVNVAARAHNERAGAPGYTDQEGRVVLDGASSPGIEVNGTVTVWVDASGTAYANTTTTFEVGSDRNVTVSLQESMRVDGTIREPDGGPAVEERVTVRAMDGSDGETVWTDADGNFSAGVSADAIYEISFVQVAKAGTWEATFPTDGVPDVYAVGTVNESANDLGTVNLPDPHNVTLEVVNENGTALSNVTVYVNHFNGDARAGNRLQTDSDGTVTVELVGEVGIHTNSPDHIDDGNRFSVSSDQTLTLVLRKGVTVSGNLSYADGTAVSGYHVGAFGGPAEHDETTSTGAFDVLVESNRTYDILYKQTDWGGGTTNFPKDGRPDLYAFEQVTVNESNVSVGSQTLPRAHMVNVTVVNESGAPLEGMHVDVLPIRGDVSGHHPGFTNADGELILDGASRPGVEYNGTLRLTVRGTEKYVRNSTEVQIASNRSITIVVQERRNVTGRIVYPNNTTHADDAVVTFGSETSDGGLDINGTAPDGSFKLTAPQADDVDVQFYQGDFWAPGGDDWPIAPRDGVVDLYAITQVDTTDGDVDLGNVTLPRGYVVNVTVVDESGDPVRNATIGVSHFAGPINTSPESNYADGGIGGIRTDEEGQLHWGDLDNQNFSTPPGIELRGNVSIDVRPPKNASGFVDQTYYRNLTVTGTRNLTVTLQEEQYRVYGHVHEPNGDPATDNSVFVFSETDGSYAPHDLTNETGAYTVPLQNDVPQDVQYYQSDFDETDGDGPNWARDGVPDIYAVERVNGTQNVNASVTLPKAHTVNVTVVDESGDPVENATVAVRHTNGLADAGLAVVRTDQQGMLHLRNVTPAGIELVGNVTVEVSPPPNSTRFQNQTIEDTFWVESDTSKRYVLQETNETTISGRIEEPDGTPAATDVLAFFIENGPGEGSFNVSTTDTEGRYQATVLRNESYDVQYYQDAWGGHDENETWMPDDDVPDIYAVERVETDVAHNVSATLPQAHDVNITVVDESGDPIHNATLYVRHHNGLADAGMYSNTTSDGQMYIPNATDKAGFDLVGNVTIRADPPNESRFTGEPTVRNLTVTGDRNVTVTLTEATETVQLNLTANRTELTSGGTVRFVLRRTDTGNRTSGTVTVGNQTTVDTGPGGVVNVTVSETGNVTVVADKQNTSTTVFERDSVTLSVTEGANLSVSYGVNRTELPTNATLGITTTVRNDGADAGTQLVEFVVDGTVVASRNVTVGAGENETVTVTRTFARPGPVEVTVNDLAPTTIAVEDPVGVAFANASVTTTKGENATIDVVVENVTGGVGALNVSLAVDAANVSIADVTVRGGPTDVNVTSGPDGRTARVEAFGIDTTTTGDVTVVTVTLHGEAAGNATVRAVANGLFNESGYPYYPRSNGSAELTVNAIPAVGDYSSPPTDVDGDGTFEDVNGDGNVTVSDVTALWEHRDGQVVQNHPDAFDYNGVNGFDLGDVQRLFTEATDD